MIGKRILLFDTETTDLISNSALPDHLQPEIIEFFGHCIEIDDNYDFKVIGELHQMFRPSRGFGPDTTRITGITWAEVEDCPPFRVHAAQVANFISSADVVAAHNLSFDYQMVEIEVRRAHLTAILDWPAIRICTVEQTEWLESFRLSLSALHEKLFGEKFEGAHRARADVGALTRCFVELVKRGII